MTDIIFPTIVYRTPGTHHCAGGTYDYLGAASIQDLDQLLEGGWFLTLPEAITGKHDEFRFDADEPETYAPTREELEAKATELGIKFDGRTTDKGLGEKIELALSEKE